MANKIIPTVILRSVGVILWLWAIILGFLGLDLSWWFRLLYFGLFSFLLVFAGREWWQFHAEDYPVGRAAAYAAALALLFHTAWFAWFFNHQGEWFWIGLIAGAVLTWTSDILASKQNGMFSAWFLTSVIFGGLLALIALIFGQIFIVFLFPLIILPVFLVGLDSSLVLKGMFSLISVLIFLGGLVLAYSLLSFIPLAAGLALAYWWWLVISIMREPQISIGWWRPVFGLLITFGLLLISPWL